MQKYRHQKTHTDAAPFFYSALMAYLVVFFGYIYFVSDAVAHVVIRKEVENEIVQQSTAVSILESEYIDLQHSVSSEIALQQGFIPAPQKIFIDTSESTLVLRGN